MKLKRKTPVGRNSFRLILLVQFVAAYAAFCHGNLLAQHEEDPNNPGTWKYFRIFARTDDDSLFLLVQDDMGIDPKLESFTIVVNIADMNEMNHYVTLGDELDPNALRFPWAQLSKPVQQGLRSWTGTNKENLNQKKLDYASVFIDVIRQIKIKEAVAPPKKERSIRSTTAYINPYLQLFGGERLGIPIKRSIGFTFGVGTKYSGPFESDQMSIGFNMLGVNISYLANIDNFNSHSLGSDSVEFMPWVQHNNIYNPSHAVELSYVIPLGNFLEVGTLNEIKVKGVDPAGPRYIFYERGDRSKPMPNNILKGNYFNAEFRYPFRLFSATRSFVYVAYYANEVNIGLTTRESRLAGAVFDFRANAVLPKVRNFQLLLEIMVSNIGEGFALNSFALGPSVRLSKRDNGKFGLITGFLNVRFKLGDFYDERERK
jgi:hypothetical protein